MGLFQADEVISFAGAATPVAPTFFNAPTGQKGYIVNHDIHTHAGVSFDLGLCDLNYEAGDHLWTISLAQIRGEMLPTKSPEGLPIAGETGRFDWGWMERLPGASKFGCGGGGFGAHLAIHFDPCGEMEPEFEVHFGPGYKDKDGVRPPYLMASGAGGLGEVLHDAFLHIRAWKMTGSGGDEYDYAMKPTPRNDDDAGIEADAQQAERLFG